ncbi:MAG: hypothetical protein KDI32_10435 [Pseudomonadales bacterium]|nr:hypothetical protein [Pseudomonadales bacterium]
MVRVLILPLLIAAAAWPVATSGGLIGRAFCGAGSWLVDWSQRLLTFTLRFTLLLGARVQPLSGALEAARRA